MDPSQTIDRISTILVFLTFIPGLWFAGIIIARIEEIFPKLFELKGLTRFIVWLALGQLFAFPLKDLIQWLNGLAQLIVYPIGQYHTSFGNISRFNIFIFTGD